MSNLPESLRRILEKQKPKPVPIIQEPTGTVTTIWRDGEIYRQDKGRTIQLKSIKPIL